MYKKIGLKVFAPASVANVAVGYDILGFPINNIGDEVIVREGQKKGLHIHSIRGNKILSKDIMKNTAGYAAYKLLESLNLLEEPIEIDLCKNMAIGTGLGSSASSAVAGAFGVNAFLGKPYSKREVLKFATLGEELADGSFHADNVAPSLLGSFILIRNNASLDFVKLPVPPGLKAVIVHPHIEILTKDSRNILSANITLKNHVKQSGNLASFIASLYKMDLELMRRSLNDCIIEPQRAKLIPQFDKIKEAALVAGALGCSISGAGPSIFCLCANSFIAENIEQSWRRIYSDVDVACDTYISDINTEGAKIL